MQWWTSFFRWTRTQLSVKREGHAKHPFSWAFYSNHLLAAKKQPKLFLKAIKLKLWPLSCSSVEHITFQHIVGEDTIMQIYTLKKKVLWMTNGPRWNHYRSENPTQNTVLHTRCLRWGVFGIANTVLRHFKGSCNKKKLNCFFDQIYNDG